MDRGYIKLWRKTLDSDILSQKNIWSFWGYCLLKASWKEHKIMVGNQEITLSPGQLVFGRKRAALDLKMSEQEIRTCVQSLSNTKNLTIKSTNKFSIITVINWDTYQQPENEISQQINTYLTSNQPAINQQSTTNKNSKKEKKEIKEKNKYIDFVFLADDEYQKLIERFGEQGTLERLDRLNVYLGSTGKKYASHYFTILSWERKDNGNGSQPQRSNRKGNHENNTPSSTKYAHLGRTINLDD